MIKYNLLAHGNASLLTKISFLDDKENFIKPEHREMILVEKGPEAMLTQLQNYIPPKFDKTDWILEMLNKQKPA